MRRDVMWGWLGPACVAVMAFVLRLWDVAKPHSVMFDETYYAKDAWSLLEHGYVRDFTDDANEKILAGQLTDLMTEQPTWIVHPNAGKWAIAAGEHLFGFNPFGWRFAAVVFGALTVFVLARLIRRLTGSTWIGCLGGLLLTLDGTHFVMSRIALLDVFLTFWIVAGVAALVADRDWVARRLKSKPGLALIRPWQLVAGVCFGLACGTKWSGLWVLAVFGVAVVIWELALRHSVGQRLTVARLFAIGIPAFGWLVVVAFFVYIAVWADFLVHHTAYETRFGHGYGEVEHWGGYVNEPTGGWWGQILDPLRSLWNFHAMTLDFHTGDYLTEKTHPYASHPAGWLVQWRPVSVSADFDQPAELCGAAADSSCVSEVLVLGNPIVWWTGVVALLTALVAWLRRPTWRWSVPLLGIAATWLPWFASTDRPIFAFYAVACVPFLIIATCLCIAGLVRRSRNSAWQPLTAAVIGAFVAFVVVAFVFFWPIWTDQLISYDAWRLRMWFNRWI